MSTNEFFFRSATIDDDAVAIAKCLYLTDDLIYPSLCSSYSDAGWIGFIRANLKNKQHIFAHDHLFVAEQNGQIVAVCCLFPCGEPFLFLENVPQKDLANYKYVGEHYFRPLLDELLFRDGVYINNLCVDPRCRGKGIGKALLQFAIEKFSERDDIFLDVLENNRSAVELYQFFAFQVQQRHPGFGGINQMDVPCLRLIHTRGIL